MSFWANYVLVKETQGVERVISLDKIEAKYGQSVRQSIEQELSVVPDGDGNG